MKTKEKTEKKQSQTYFEKLDLNSFGAVRSGFGKAMFELSSENKDVVALCADLTDSVKLGDFAKKFPQRFFQTGICEQNMVSAAAGMTLAGKIPFAASYAAFSPGRTLDQIRVSVCYSNSNVKIVGTHAGLTTGPDGATHQALEDIAIMRTLPNMLVLVPCDENQAYMATKALANYKGPAYIRLSREKSLNITKPNQKFELGKAQILDEGEDLTIISCGLALQFAIEAVDILKKQYEVNATLLNMHTIKPLDIKTLEKYAKKTKAIVSVEEHQIAGGLGSAIAEHLVQTIPCAQEFVGVNDSFGESGTGYELLKKYGISTSEIVKRSLKVLKRK